MLPVLVWRKWLIVWKSPHGAGSGSGKGGAMVSASWALQGPPGEQAGRAESAKAMVVCVEAKWTILPGGAGEPAETTRLSYPPGPPAASPFLFGFPDGPGLVTTLDPPRRPGPSFPPRPRAGHGGS